MVENSGNPSAPMAATFNEGTADIVAQDKAKLEARITKDIEARLGERGGASSIGAEGDTEVRAIDIAKQRVMDYRITFTSEAGRRVLADLREFCLGDQDTFAADPYVSSYNQGRRRVFLRIDQSMRLDDARIEALVRAQLEQQRGH